MLLLKRFIPFITLIIVFIGLEMILKKPAWLYWLSGFLLLFLLFSFWVLVGSIGRGKKRFFLIPGLSLVFSSILFIVFLENWWLKHFVVIIVSIIVGILLESVFFYLYYPKKYQRGTLSYLNNYIVLVSIFFFYSGFYSLYIFLGIWFWLLSLISLLITFLLAYQILWLFSVPGWQTEDLLHPIFSKKTEGNKSIWIFALIISLVLTELFWAGGFLPTSFYVNGLILAIIYYILTNLSQFYILDKLEAKIVKRYLIIGLIVLILILGTAQY